MRNNLKALVATLVLGPALAGCLTVSDDPVAPDAGPVGPGPSGTTKISGDITQNATWSGKVEISAVSAIKAGVTVTVTEGTEIVASDAAGLQVQGTLAIQGTAAKPVKLNAIGSMPWKGITVESGGSASLLNVTGSGVLTLLNCKAGAVGCSMESVQFTSIGKAIEANAAATIKKSKFELMKDNGSVTVGTTGDLSITDTTLYNTSSDIIIMNGAAKLVLDHSRLGSTMGGEHCNFHINSAGSLTVTRNIIESGSYGFMISGTNGAVINYNNFLDNGIDFSPTGTNTSTNLQRNYWSKGAPTNLGAGYDVSMAETSMITDAGPRI